MAAVLAVGGLFARRSKDLFHEGEVTPKKEAAMKQKKAAFATLSIAGELLLINGQIRVAFDGDGCGNQPGHRVGVSLHDPGVGRSDTFERAGDRKDEGVVQATRGLKDRAAASTSP